MQNAECRILPWVIAAIIIVAVELLVLSMVPKVSPAPVNFNQPSSPQRDSELTLSNDGRSWQWRWSYSF